LRSSLRLFVDDCVKPSLEKLEALQQQLSEGEVVDLEEYLQDNFDEVFHGINSKLRLHSSEVSLEEPFGVTGLGEPGEINIQEVLALEGDEVYVEFNVLYEDTLVFAYVPHFDAYGLDDESTFHVTDPNWNEWYSQVEATLDLDVTCGMTINRGSGEVLSFEVKDARNVEKEW